VLDGDVSVDDCKPAFFPLWEMVRQMNAMDVGIFRTVLRAAPVVFTRLASWLVQAKDALRCDLRNAKLRPANPISIIAQVDGSGTPGVKLGSAMIPTAATGQSSTTANIHVCAAETTPLELV
jgi:hypothetical protein